MIASALRFGGYEVSTENNGFDALRAIKSQTPDVIVLDVNMPELRRVRSVPADSSRRQHDTGHLPHGPGRHRRQTDRVSSRRETTHLTKPFSLEELGLRVEALLRRSRTETNTSRVTVGELSIDESAHQVRWGDDLIDLSPTEFRLVHFLAMNQGNVMSKAQIVAYVWEYDYDGNYGIVETYVSYLRRKLGTAGADLIETVRGVGYVIRTPMTLRARITLAVALLLLAVVVAIGVIASRSIEQILVSEVDDVPVGFSLRGPGVPPPGQDPDSDDQIRRDTAEIMIDQSGEVVWTKEAGFVDDPLPLPDIAEVELGSKPTTVSSADGSVEYRAIALETPSGMTLVRAIPLDFVTNATNSFVRTVALAGGVVLIIGSGVAWWTVSRATRPVEEMVATAEEIAAGDLTQRVSDYQEGTELGTLARSINQMMTTIEESVEKEKAGQETMRLFVADASHELRTPITAISGYAELHRRGGLASEQESDKAWQRIESESGRMASLVEDLLLLARVGESQPLQVEEVDIAAIAAAAVERPPHHRPLPSSRARGSGPSDHPR